MKLAGFNFTKISVEKISDKIENLKINTSIDISEIGEVKSEIFKLKEQMVAVSFKHSLNYEPDIAKIEFSGTLILGVESRLAREVIKQWKDKKLPPEFRVNLFNIILRKCHVKALELEEDLNIPLHIKMPNISKQAFDNAKSAEEQNPSSESQIQSQDSQENSEIQETKTSEGF